MKLKFTVQLLKSPKQTGMVYISTFRETFSTFPNTVMLWPILSQISFLVTLALNKLDAHVTRKQCAVFRFIPAAWHISSIIIWQAILKAKSSSLIGYSSVGILRYGPLPWKRSIWIFFYFFHHFSIFFIISGKFPDIVPEVDLNEQLEVSLRIKMMPYNKLLTNFTRSGPYWGILALGRFCTISGQYSPVRPSRSVSKRLIND